MPELLSYQHGDTGDFEGVGFHSPLLPPFDKGGMGGFCHARVNRNVNTFSQPRAWNPALRCATRRGRGWAGMGRDGRGMERETGFEPATLALARRCSTAELFPPTTIWNFIAESPRGCQRA